MPQHKSAKKRVKTSLVSQDRNRAVRSALRRSIREFRADSTTDREAAAKQVNSVLDRAVKRGIIHRNKAARLKQRLVKTG